MVKTRSGVMRNKGLGGKKNDSYEKKCLLRSIDPMNFQFADRCHAVNYAAAIEKKNSIS